MSSGSVHALEIVPLTLDDVPAVDAIEQRSMPAPWSRLMFVSEIAKPSSICLGAFLDGALVGYVIVSRYVDAWHVMDLVVAAEFRRRRIATRLLEALFERAEADPRRGFTLEVRVSNDSAIKLYENLGFRSQGVRRGYYTDNREDALIMWRDAAPELAER
jgi:ribosomal-protein-alanine N-acetyltransferase